MRLAIGVPTSRWASLEMGFFLSYLQLTQRLREQGIGTVLLTAEAFPIDAARNEICRAMLTTDADALLFLDADHLFGADLYDRLAAHGKAVITARYHVRRPPFHANCYVKHPLAPPGQFKTVHYGRGCFEIDRGGAGALLIQRRVIEAIGDRWFEYQANPNEGEPNDRTVSEDFWFYEQAQTFGFSCWVDWETEAQHIAKLAVGLDHATVYLEAMAAEMTPELASQLVVCGHDRPVDVGGYSVAPFSRATPLREVAR